MSPAHQPPPAPVPPPPVPPPVPGLVPTPPLELGRVLEGTPYRAHTVIGKGAQGLVLDAEHVALGKPVVVKVLHERHGLAPRVVERMKLEAQALARLSSPHLVAVTDLGTLPDGRPYFVMEKLWGRTLKAAVREGGPLSPAEAIAIARQVLSGLAVVHRAGLVHRDVKPENVFLCEPRDGAPSVVKLLDFGVAKVAPTAYGAVVSAPAPTAANMAIGTPRFLSPEQACATDVDGRADLYSVGVLLFWTLAGRDPFAHHKAMSDVLMAHVTEAPPAPSLFTATPVPPALESAIRKAMQKLPQDRFASADAFQEALAAVRTDEAPAVTTRGAGTVRMGRPEDEDDPTTRKVAPRGATIRLGEGAAPRALAGPAWLGRIGGGPLARWARRARRVVPSAGVVGLVAITAASVTLALLLAARLLGLVH